MEVLVAAVLVGLFFATIFEVNAVCLRYVSASKENLAGIEGVQDRLEQLRNLDWPTLTSSTSLSTLLTSPANGSPLAAIATETVTIQGYPSGSPSITFTRAPGISVVPVPTPSTVDFSSTRLVRLDVTYQWYPRLSSRSRTEKTSTIVSAGTKK